MSTNSQTLDAGYAHLAQVVAQLLPQTMQLTVEPGTDMADDNAYLAPHHHLFAQLVQQRLLSALDHLQLVAAARSDAGDVHAFAQSSLIRAAIIGTCTPIWLMTGDAEERRMKALKLIYKDADEYRKYLNAGAREPKFAAQRDDFLDTAKAFKLRGEAAFDAARKLDPALTQNKFETLRDTDVVVAAGRALDPSGFDGWDPSISLERQWRMLSGYVHNYPWATRPDWTEVGRNPDGTAQHQTTGDPERILDSAFIAVNVAQQALAQFAKLSTP